MCKLTNDRKLLRNKTVRSLFITEVIFITEAHSTLKSEMEHFPEIVNIYSLLTIFTNCSILDVSQCSEYASLLQLLLALSI